MKEFGIERMDDNEEELADGLMELGVSRHVARTLACLNTMKTALSTDLELATGLRQPEVSMAMRELRGEGWITETIQKKERGKGRPNKIYTLKVGFDKIIDTIESRKNDEQKVITAGFTKLRNLAK